MKDSITLEIDAFQKFVGDLMSISAFFCKKKYWFCNPFLFCKWSLQSLCTFPHTFLCRWELQTSPWPHLNSYSSGHFMCSHDLWWKPWNYELGPSSTYSTDSLESLDAYLKFYAAQIFFYWLKCRFTNVWCAPIAY